VSWTFLLAALLLRVAAPEQPSRFAADTTSTAASLLAADSALAAGAARRGDVVVLDAFEPDGALLFTGQPILRADSGRAAFMARYAEPSVYRWRPLHAIVSVDGLFGCTVGLSTFRDAHDSAQVSHAGAYETCWRRASVQGRWRIVALQRSDSPPDAPKEENARRAAWPHSATVSHPGDQRAQTLDTDTEFARVAALPAGPGPAFVQFVADDGMTLGGDTFSQGRREIGAAFEGYPADRYIAWLPDRRFGAASGGLAYTVGHSDHLPRDGKTGRRGYGKFLTVWRQAPDGRWEFVFDLGSPRTSGKTAGS
jgi:ketosteroid isomerase-like protein